MDSELSGGVNTPPYYADFRAEINRLYPAHSHLIAIRNSANKETPRLFELDLISQLSEEARGRQAAEDYTVNSNYLIFGLSQKEQSPFAYNFYPVADGKLQYQNPAHFSYISTLPDQIDPAELLCSLSENKIPSLCMTFQAAATNPSSLKWFSFYHELSHALMALHVHPVADDVYQHYLNEAICDSFAAIHILRRDGAAAIPMLRTIADMRLSKFKEEGPLYFTAPAIRAVIFDFENGRLDNLDVMPASIIFSHAKRYANENFLHRPEVETWLLAEKARQWPRKFLFSLQREDNIEEHYCYPLSPGKPWRLKQANLFRESQVVMERYCPALRRTFGF